MNDDPLLFAGSASGALAAEIADYLGLRVSSSEVMRFSEGNLFVRVLENVRGRDVFLVQGTVFPANDQFMELLFWIDAFKRASAASVTALIPYFSYAKGDKKDEPRVSIRARVCADAIEAAGVDRVITMDLHAPQVQGFFKVPVDDLYALPLLVDEVSRMHLPNLVVVSPDAGFVKKARRFASRLGAPLAIADKQRTNHTEHPDVLDVMGEVRECTALLVDDFIVSGGTLTEAATALRDRGARAIYAAVTHGLFCGTADSLIERSQIEELFVTNTVESSARPRNVRVVSVAPLFGEAIRRIHSKQSISTLFD